MTFCHGVASGDPLPDSVVWCIDGDGCFQMTNQELATCSIENIPIKVAVINNGNLGIVRQWQNLFYSERYSQTDLGTHKHRIPDFLLLAEAMGCVGLRAESKEDVDRVIHEAMAINDRSTTGKLHPRTREALDRMWTLQRADGSWNWNKHNLPPQELDEYYGVVYAALGVGVAPDAYAKGESARDGVARLKQYLKQNPPPSLHHKTMLLWASLKLDRLAVRPRSAAMKRCWLRTMSTTSAYRALRAKSRPSSDSRHTASSGSLRNSMPVTVRGML